MKKYTLLVLVLALSVLVTGCNFGGRNSTPEGEYQEVRRTFFPMDTILDVVVQTQDTSSANEAIDLAYEEIVRLELLLSATIETSEVSLINQNAGIKPVKVSEETFELLELGIKYGEITNGKFDITIAPLLKLYNWKEGQETQAEPDSDKILEAKQLVNYKDLQLDKENMTAYLTKPNMEIDLGGIAKGYIIDRSIDVLKESGLTHGFVNGGGDIRFLGPKHDESAWRIGIKNPRGEGNVAVVNVYGNSIVSSGDYERYYFTKEGRRIHHIIDPFTGTSSEYAQSVTIVAENATIADILSTALFMFPTQEALSLAVSLNAEAAIISADGYIYMTPGMEDITTLVN